VQDDLDEPEHTADAAAAIGELQRKRLAKRQWFLGQPEHSLEPQSEQRHAGLEHSLDAGFRQPVHAGTAKRLDARGKRAPRG
jgi:hypothetical protein